jgi:hypothetical protein
MYLSLRQISSHNSSFIFNSLGWDETESTWYVGHHLAQPRRIDGNDCGAIGRMMTREIEVLGGTLPQCHFVLYHHHHHHHIWDLWWTKYSEETCLSVTLSTTNPICGGGRSTRRKPASVSLCPPQIPYDVILARTLVTAMGNLGLTAWAMARPNSAS